ncbi:unnamed protein product [Hymenolepis diminuta]|uniref:SANT domain-containing protein n=1 Tax=Hymenolepis diminuta TaxID=6216 RepID=A0A0R3SJA5_HYMDI|nr:unnamed protein product [Hymenolepis diminuta]
MKTRSTPEEPPNIAAGVKARRTARIGSPSSRANTEGQTDEGSNSQPVPSTSQNKTEDPAPKLRQGPKVPLRELWTLEDRRLFFEGVRIYGRNYREIARYIQSRGHRVDISTGGSVNQPSTSGEASGAGTKSNAPTVIAPVAAAAGLLPNSPAVSQSAGRTKAQVRMFYQQTWHKLRRYITFPEEVPLHVREVYAIVNWSVMRSRIKKALDNRLGEKLNEFVQTGSTYVKHHGRRYLLRTPTCQILKQLNNISSPTQNFTLPDDVVVELVPATQLVAWRVLEAEQNPRLRLIVDINRQLSDVISITEVKWTPQNILIGRGLGSDKQKQGERIKTNEMLRLRLEKEHRLDGAISIQEVSRTRSTDVCLNAFVNRIRSTAAATLLSNTTAPPPTANATTANASTTNYGASSTSTEGRLLQSYFSCTIIRALLSNTKVTSLFESSLSLIFFAEPFSLREEKGMGDKRRRVVTFNL